MKNLSEFEKFHKIRQMYHNLKNLSTFEKSIAIQKIHQNLNDLSKVEKIINIERFYQNLKNLLKFANLRIFVVPILTTDGRKSQEDVYHATRTTRGYHLGRVTSYRNVDSKMDGRRSRYIIARHSKLKIFRLCNLQLNFNHKMCVI